MGVCPITLTKFIGTFSLGLLTGTSYSLSRLILPTLSNLPSSTSASQSLTTLQYLTTRATLTLSSIASLSLITAYTLASRRNKHPYLIWTALTAFIAGQGVELFYNGTERILASAKFTPKTQPTISETSERGRPQTLKASSESGFIEISRDQSSATDASAVTPNSDTESDREVNGEKIEVEIRRERKVQVVRSLVAGVGFMMGVVGIWGDGA